MRDFKYLQLVSGKIQMKAFSDAIKAVRSKAIRPAALAFGVNMERLKNLAVTPAEIGQQARRDAALLFYAEYLVTGKIVKPFSGDPQDKWQEVLAKFHELLKEFIIGLNENQYGVLIEQLGVTLVETMIKDTPGMEKSMEALLSSMVIGYWAAFETLAADLWKSAVNSGPPVLANRVNLATGRIDPNLAAQLGEGQQYDIRSDYAGSMIETERVSFGKLQDITRWYKTTFKNDANTIFKNNSDIHAVAAYRNALVHTSGRADKHFIKQIAPVDDLRGQFNVNDSLNLDGEFVARLRDATCKVGLELIQMADDLLSPKTANDAASDS